MAGLRGTPEGRSRGSRYVRPTQALLPSPHLPSPPLTSPHLPSLHPNPFHAHPRRPVQPHPPIAQMAALGDLKALGRRYGFDLSHPATCLAEAVQWTYFGYLAAIQDQDGAAMSFGRVDAFLDIFAERDLKAGRLDERQVQELIDQLVIKMRCVRHLRAPAYNELFSGDPTWVTTCLGGVVERPDGALQHMVSSPPLPPGRSAQRVP